MADPLSLLRQCNIYNRKIVERNGEIVLGEVPWSKNTRTNFVKFGSGKDGKPKEYYTLECLLFFLKNISLSHPVYVRQAAAANIPTVHRPDRRDLTAYLCGETTTCRSIDKGDPSDLPTEIDYSDTDNSRDVLAKKPRIEGNLKLDVLTVNKQFPTKSDVLKESTMNISNIKRTNVTYCAALNCRSKSSSYADVSFFPFPKDEALKTKWLLAMKRVDSNSETKLWQPSHNSRLCSKHFLPDDIDSESSKLKSHAVPSIFSLNDEKKVAQKVKVVTVNDPLHLLREFYINQKEIIEENDHIIFGDLSWPKNVRTNYIQHGWCQDKTPKEYYTLECLLFFLKNISLTHSAYAQKAIAANMPSVHQRDRQDLIKYLTGKWISCPSIDPSGPLETPTIVIRCDNDVSQEVVIEKPGTENETFLQVPAAKKQSELTTTPFDTVTKIDVPNPPIEPSCPVGYIIAPNSTASIVNGTGNIVTYVDGSNNTVACVNGSNSGVTYINPVISTTNVPLVPFVPFTLVAVPANNFGANIPPSSSQNEIVADPDDIQLTNEVKQMKSDVMRMDQKLQTLTTNIDELKNKLQTSENENKMAKAEIEDLKQRIWKLEGRLYLRSRKRTSSTT